MIVFAAVFVLTVIIVGKIINKDHNNLTVEMAPAGLPLVTMEYEGMPYNRLHGYVNAMNVALLRDCITLLDENRSVNVRVDTFGAAIAKLGYELRSLDGERLIEETQLNEWEREGDRIRTRIALKDLIDPDTEYSLAVKIMLEDGRTASYYTSVIRSDKLHLTEKLDFVRDFHNATFDIEEAREYTRYLETNTRLEKNESFHKVNIHSSLKQITWGDLGVSKVGNTAVRLTGIDGGNATFVLEYSVQNTEEENAPEYEVEEYYRVRYTTDRMYLLDFQRTMTQVPDLNNFYANDKFLLGIADENVAMMESEDGNSLAFQVADRLYGYDINSNKLIQMFSFCDGNNDDLRTRYKNHAIKILDVEEGGNTTFAVYGYMNRGRHEGEVGIALMRYDSALNTTEELLYIVTDKPYQALACEMEKLIFANRNNQLFLEFDRTVYAVDLQERSAVVILQETRDDCLKVSDNGEIIVWTEGEDFYHCRLMQIYNLVTNRKNAVYVSPGEAIIPLGFMEEDIIYGVAKESDVVKENSGNTFFPMFKICICNAEGVVVKEYQQPDVYVTACSIEANQITLTCLERNDSGKYKEIADDHITNNTEAEPTKNTVVSTDIDVYERYVQIKVRKNIDSKSIKILNPKEVVYEGGRGIELPKEEDTMLYYAYGPRGVEGVYSDVSLAVDQAYSLSGKVLNSDGTMIWKKEARQTKNQIMFFKEAKSTEEKSSIAVCLESMFSFCGLSYNTQPMLDEGKTTLDILREGMESETVLNLTGCSLDAVLYYVDREVPVLALLRNGEAVLITGFNAQNTVIMNPVSGTLYKKGMNDSKDWFEENGNCFITYVPHK